MSEMMASAVRETVALLPGSYDPVTFGHLDVIAKASAMFSRVIVAVMTNDMRAYVADAKVKRYLLTLEERREVTALACAAFPNVCVISGEGRLIDLFDAVGATLILKGLRDEKDYRYEQEHTLWNRAHNPRAQTLYLPAEERYGGVSSTLVRERLAAGKRVDDLVPEVVAEWLYRRQESTVRSGSPTEQGREDYGNKL